MNARDDEIWTLLLRAAEKGHDEIVGLLVEKGADLETKNTIFGTTPLIWGHRSRNKVVVKRLREKGANIDSRDTRGQTPLSKAAESGHEAIVKLLLEKGANIDLSDVDRQTPLSWAAESGHEAVVKLLQLHKGQSSSTTLL